MGLLNTVKNLIVGREQQPVPALGRNDVCWCGSGKKYKTCHLSSDERKRSAQRAAAGSRPTGGMF